MKKASTKHLRKDNTMKVLPTHKAQKEKEYDEFKQFKE